MSFKQALKTFIQQNLASDTRLGGLDDDTPLIEGGIIDSMGLMHVIMFIEEQTGIKVPDAEVLPENFATIPSIERLVDRLRMKSLGVRGLPH